MIENDNPIETPDAPDNTLPDNPSPVTPSPYQADTSPVREAMTTTEKTAFIAANGMKAYLALPRTSRDRKPKLANVRETMTVTEKTAFVADRGLESYLALPYSKQMD